MLKLRRAYGAHPRWLFAFSLDGERDIPPSPPPYVPEPLAYPDFVVDHEAAAEGAQDDGPLCAACHGPQAVAAGMAPDLRASAVVLSAESFEQVVRDGGRVAQGMPPYTTLTSARLNAIRHYIRQQAEAALPAQP